MSTDGTLDFGPILTEKVEAFCLHGQHCRLDLTEKMGHPVIVDESAEVDEMFLYTDEAWDAMADQVRQLLAVTRSRT